MNDPENSMLGPGTEKPFVQVKPLMSETEAWYESARCLFCHDAPCTLACPTAIDIPLFIRQINTGNLAGAAKTIYSSNYLGNTCAKVCPTEMLCEGACVFNKMNIKPLEIGRLQNFATDRAIRAQMGFSKVPEPNGSSVAVIGAGPSGIACACELRSRGFKVDIFEATDWPSGLALYGVAPYKITNAEVLHEVEYLEKLFGFTVFYGEHISGRAALESLESRYDAVFLGIGLGNSADLHLKGEEKQHCTGATEFIRKIKTQPVKVPLAAKVIVLGGGNTAMDVASESAKLGAEAVTIVYRRSQRQMKAYGFEFDFARLSGVTAIFNAAPVEIVGENAVEGVRFIRTETAEGKLRNIPGSEFLLPCDLVVKATGQAKQTSLLAGIPGLALDETGRILVNEATGQTSNPKYFAGGDAVNGGKEVVNAVAMGKIAGKGIQEYLTGLKSSNNKNNG